MFVDALRRSDAADDFASYSDGDARGVARSARHPLGPDVLDWTGAGRRCSHSSTPCSTPSNTIRPSARLSNRSPHRLLVSRSPRRRIGLGSIRSGSPIAELSTTSSVRCFRNRSFPRCRVRSSTRRRAGASGGARPAHCSHGSHSTSAFVMPRSPPQKLPLSARAPATLSRASTSRPRSAQRSWVSSPRKAPSRRSWRTWSGAICCRAQFTRSSRTSCGREPKRREAMPNAPQLRRA